MRLEELLRRLPTDVVARASLADPDADVHNVSFLMGDSAGEPLGDVLYFADSELLPKDVDGTHHFSCIVVDGADASTPLEDLPNVNLVWLSQGTNLFTCYNVIQSAFLEDQRIVSVMARLLEAHFSNQGLQYLIEEAADALDNPVVVVDPTYSYIAYHFEDLGNDESQLAQVMLQEIASESVLDQAVAYIRSSHIDSNIARSNGPYVQFNEILGCNTMTEAVMVQGVCIAHIMMMERSHSFSDFDRIVFERLSSFVAQELQKSEVWGRTSGELGSYFLENLLNDRSPSVAVTRRRLKALNFHPKPLLYVVCFQAPGEGLTQTQAEYVAGQLRPVLHHSLYTRHHRHLVALISRDPEVGFSEQAERTFREVALLNGLSVGVSNTFTNLTETRLAYEQARSAIRHGEMLSPYIDDRSLYRFSDYAFWHLLYLAGRRTNLLTLCDPALLKLLEYDNDHGCELMETLYCYLQVAGSTARAAKVLNLHKNTMLYRLGRIRELLGMDLSSGSELFNLHFGFRTLIMLGLFSPRMRLERHRSSGTKQIAS